MAVHFSGLANSSNTDTYGFFKPADFDEKAYERFMSEYLPVLAKRSKRWTTMLPSGGSGEKRKFSFRGGTKETEEQGAVGLPQGILAERKLKRFVRKGIPFSMRPKIWLLLSGAEDRQRSHSGEYRRLIKIPMSKEAASAIDLDLDRTFPDNEYFQTLSCNMKAQLNQVLHAIAVKHPEIGYCQGLNYLAGMLLLILKCPEGAFWQLDTMLMECSDYYTPGMKGLQVDVQVFRELLRQKDPDLVLFFARMDLDLLLMTSKWFLCWFLETLPIETVLRIWDCFFNEGSKILLRVSMTLLLKNKDQFLYCQNFSEATDCFKKILTGSYVMNCHQLMEDIFELPGRMSNKTIETLRAKFRAEI